MFANENRARLRFLPLLAAVFALALFAGCGDDDDEGGGEAAAEIQQVEVTASGQGSLKGPKQLQAGLNEITLTNDANGPSDLQLIYVEGDRSGQEVLKAFAKAGSGTPFEPWFFGGGGVGTTEPGASRTVMQSLQPGTYYGFNTEVRGKPPYMSFEVSGEESDAELPSEEATVTASEYAFESEGLKPGANRLVFDNAGGEPHHVIAMPIVGDATIEDVEEFFKTEKGKPPVAFEKTVSTAVLEGGDSQVTDLELEQGRWAFVCFISDRQGGPPHALKGMVSEVEVE